MTVICCTQKLRKELGVKDKELISEPETCAGVGSWYANLLRFGPKKCVLFINAKTCYGVIALNVRRAEIRELGKLLIDRLPLVMRSDGFGDEVIDRVLAEHCDFSIGKATNKRILGYLTDLGRHARYAIELDGSVEQADEIDLTQLVNHIPLLSFDGAYGYDLFSILLTGGIKNADNEYKQKLVEKYRKEFGKEESAKGKIIQFPAVSRGGDGPTYH